MRTNQVKIFAIIFLALPLFLLTVFKVTPVKVAASTDDDPATTFTSPKNLCFACHTKKAEKNFDPAKPDAELVEAILKGREKTDKRPIPMKAFGPAMTEEQAKALVDYMRSLRKPAN